MSRDEALVPPFILSRGRVSCPGSDLVTAVGPASCLNVAVSCHGSPASYLRQEKGGCKNFFISLQTKLVQIHCI